MATYTNFCCRSGGDNLNAGTKAGDTTQPGTGPSNLYEGTWVASTGVFTVSAGSPASENVNVGDFASVYTVGDTKTGFIGRVTARDFTTITVSLTAKSGSAPADGSRQLRIGGAWEGPSAGESFPFNLVGGAMQNASANRVRINMKNDQVYTTNATSGGWSMGIASDPVQGYTTEGYTTSYGDGGEATFTGGSTGTAFVLLNIGNGGGVQQREMKYIKFDGNGGTGLATLVNCTAGASNHIRFYRCRFWNSRGSGLYMLSSTDIAIECEAYQCCLNNSLNEGGFRIAGQASCVRCISHHNGTGTNGHGFSSATNLGATWIGCVSYLNGGCGFISQSNGIGYMANCDAYYNGTHGIFFNNTVRQCDIENCNALRNGGWGIAALIAGTYGRIANCGVGSGSMANTSGGITVASSMDEVGTITYPGGLSPWADPGNGDFRLGNIAEGRGAGIGAYIDGVTIGYPDIGAAPTQYITTDPDDVRDGVDFGASLVPDTGVLTSPAESDVISGVTYGADGTEYEGQYSPPSTADVRFGVSYGVAGGSGGLLIIPSVNDVRAGTLFGTFISFTETEFTGTLALPTEDNVILGVGYGANGSELTGDWYAPPEDRVAEGYTYGPGGTLYTGSFHPPAESDVRAGTVYGKVVASEFVGTLRTNFAHW